MSWGHHVRSHRQVRRPPEPPRSECRPGIRGHCGLPDCPRCTRGERGQKMTRDQAYALLERHYSAGTLEDDPCWVREMVEGLVTGGITLDD